MIVVADTSAVNYLILIGEAHLLFELYGGVMLPRAVRLELLAEHSPGQVRGWTAAPPEWV